MLPATAMPITDPRCPTCNGQLPLSAGAKLLTCPYCGNQVLLSVLEARPPVPPGPSVQAVRQQAVQQLAIRVSSGARNQASRINPLFIILPIIGILIGVGVSVYFAVNAATKATRTAQNAQRAAIKRVVRQRFDTPDIAKLKRAARIRTGWGDARLMRTARINGDDIDDILLLGTYRDDKRTRRLYLFAFDGASFARIYRTGPFGDFSENRAASRTNMTVAGSYVLVTDYKATAHVLDLASGKELRAVGLTDRAQVLCPDPADPDRVWIEVSDKRHVTMKVSTTTLAPSKRRPTWCPRSNRMGCRAIGGAFTCDRSSRRRGRAKGFRPDTRFTMGGHNIALGTRSPGSSWPMVAAYAPNTGKRLWARALVQDVTASVKERAPQHASVAGGRVIADYQLGKNEYRMVALDATSGAQQWDVRIPATGFAIMRYAIVASPTRIFVPNEGVIHVFDAATGKLLGTAGVPE